MISAEILKASSAGDWSSVEAEINSGAFSVNDQREVGYSDNMNILDVNEEPAEGDGVPSPTTTPKIRRFVADNDPQNSQSN